MVKIKFFAALRERLECCETTVDVVMGDTIHKVRQRLVQKHPKWQHELLANDVLCAVNYRFAAYDATVREGDEVAFFPPVTGG